MRTSLDIPDDLYRKIKVHIDERGMSLREFLLASAREALNSHVAPASESWRSYFGIMAEYTDELDRVQRRTNAEFD